MDSLMPEIAPSALSFAASAQLSKWRSYEDRQNYFFLLKSPAHGILKGGTHGRKEND
jgi:hypothetical protein